MLIWPELCKIVRLDHGKLKKDDLNNTMLSESN